MRKWIAFLPYFFISFLLMGQAPISSTLKTFIVQLESESDLIPADRRKALQGLALDIQKMGKEVDTVKLTFICTHNSRRSQLGEIWLQTAATYYGLGNLRTYSGGTEATAFNHRMVDALLRAGFPLEKKRDGPNPEYVCFEDQAHTYFSKKYDDTTNPDRGFIAIMVCTQADEACPLVKGSVLRISLPYQDPKAFDDSPNELSAYDAKVRELGREWIYLTKLLKGDQE